MQAAGRGWSSANAPLLAFVSSKGRSGPARSAGAAPVISDARRSPPMSRRRRKRPDRHRSERLVEAGIDHAPTIWRRSKPDVTARKPYWAGGSSRRLLGLRIRPPRGGRTLDDTGVLVLIELLQITVVSDIEVRDRMMVVLLASIDDAGAARLSSPLRYDRLPTWRCATQAQ